jgi:multidrug resistance efflux pump
MTTNQEPPKPEKAPAPVAQAAAAPPAETPPAAATPPPKPGKGTKRGAIIVLALIFVTLLWHFIADRLTPYSSQARVQAFVVPVAPEVSGTVLKVHVKNNDVVKPGQPLFDIDPTNYRIAVQRSTSDLELIRLSVDGSNASVEAARESVRAARAGHVYAQQDAARLEQIYKEDPGALSLRRVQNAQANRIKAGSQEKAAEADVRRALAAAGEAGEKNAQLQSARAALEKAELDLKRTKIVAPSGGSVTDLQTDVGRFAQAGAAVMTLVTIHDLWISADMTENNLGNVKPGDKVAIVLDVMPGEVLKGRVRSVGTGIAPGKPAQPGALPEVDNSRDWLRQAQRFPVAVEFEAAERERLKGVRVGGQADVLIYTGDNPVMNWLGGIFICAMSYFSYLY